MNEVLRGKAQVLKAGAERIMYMPGGLHTITLSKGGKPHTITVQVDAMTAQTLQTDLDAKLAASEHRPLFDFAHDEKQASAWPTGFSWQDAPAPGVYAAVEWSDEGLQAVQGKTYRAFSPSFYAQPLHGTSKNPAVITGAPFVMGGLVNDPAFKQIAPLWARNKAGAHPAKPTGGTDRMKDNDTLATLQAKATELEKGIDTLKATANHNPKDVDDAQAELAGVKLQIENAQLKAQNEEHEAKAKATLKANAEAAVADAVARGAISGRDEELKAKWVKKITDDPEAVTLLAATKGNPALTLGRVTLHGNAQSPKVDITKEDMVNVLRAYEQEKDPTNRGTLYAQAISPRFGELETLKAATALGTVAGEVITQRTLELLQYEHPMLGAITTDLSSEAAPYGIEINTRSVTVPGTVEYHVTDGYVVQDSTTVDVPVTIDQHKAAVASFNANQLSGTVRNLFGEQAEAMGSALADDIVSDLYALILQATFTNTVIALATLTRASVVAGGAVLSAAKVPRANRYLVLNATQYGNLAVDDDVTALGTQQQSGIITGSRLPELHGFQVIEDASFPANSENNYGFGFHRSALVLATRLPNDYANAFPGANGGGTISVVTNPQSGLSVQLAQYVDHQKGTATMRLALMWGVAVGHVTAGQIWDSA